MRVLWVRHGEMDMRASELGDVNAVNGMFNHRLQGQLTEGGRRQAEAVSDYLRGQAVDALYCSPLVRARQTAEICGARLHLPVEGRDELTELRPGRFPETGAMARLLERLVGVMPKRGDRPQRSLGGPLRGAAGASLIALFLLGWRTGTTIEAESVSEFYDRLEALYAQLHILHREDGTVVLFAHGYIMLLHALSIGSRRQRLRIASGPYIPHCGIVEVQLRAREPPRLVSFAKAVGLRKLDGD